MGWGISVQCRTCTVITTLSIIVLLWLIFMSMYACWPSFISPTYPYINSTIHPNNIHKRHISWWMFWAFWWACIYWGVWSILVLTLSVQIVMTLVSVCHFLVWVFLLCMVFSIWYVVRCMFRMGVNVIMLLLIL